MSSPTQTSPTPRGVSFLADTGAAPQPCPPDVARAQRFAALYDNAYADVLRFVTRRSPPGVAEDIVQEAFLVAWRRLDDLPDGDDGARAWLFTTARNCLLSSGRARARRDELGVNIALSLHPGQEHTGDHVSARLELIEAWQQLSPRHQEVLSLAVWEALPAAAAGSVLGISAPAYRIRLHRARAALRRHLGTTDEPTNITPKEHLS